MKMPLDRLVRAELILLLVLSGAAPGCGHSCSSPGRTTGTMGASELPPAYPRTQILDPKLAEAARQFAAWAGEQRVRGQPLFERVEVLPPVPTLLPYGIGNYQKEPRLPAILITGPGWETLSQTEREAQAARAFREISARLAALATKAKPPLRATVTIQTPHGLQLAWINQLNPGQELLHGEDE